MPHDRRGGKDGKHHRDKRSKRNDDKDRHRDKRTVRNDKRKDRNDKRVARNDRYDKQDDRRYAEKRVERDDGRNNRDQRTYNDVPVQVPVVARVPPAPRPVVQQAPQAVQQAAAPVQQVVQVAPAARVVPPVQIPVPVAAKPAPLAKQPSADQVRQVNVPVLAGRAEVNSDDFVKEGNYVAIEPGYVPDSPRDTGIRVHRIAADFAVRCSATIVSNGIVHLAWTHANTPHLLVTRQVTHDKWVLTTHGYDITRGSDTYFGNGQVHHLLVDSEQRCYVISGDSYRFSVNVLVHDAQGLKIQSQHPQTLVVPSSKPSAVCTPVGLLVASGTQVWQYHNGQCNLWATADNSVLGMTYGQGFVYLRTLTTVVAYSLSGESLLTHEISANAMHFCNGLWIFSTEAPTNWKTSKGLWCCRYQVLGNSPDRVVFLPHAELFANITDDAHHLYLPLRLGMPLSQFNLTAVGNVCLRLGENDATLWQVPNGENWQSITHGARGQLWTATHSAPDQGVIRRHSLDSLSNLVGVVESVTKDQVHVVFPGVMIKQGAKDLSGLPVTCVNGQVVPVTSQSASSSKIHAVVLHPERSILLGTS